MNVKNNNIAEITDGENYLELNLADVVDDEDGLVLNVGNNIEIKYDCN